MLIKDTNISINNSPLNISGKIDSNSIANLYIKGNKIPLIGIYNAFAPREVKSKYDLNSALLSIDSRVTGAINNLVMLVKSNLENVDFRAKNGEFIIKNGILRNSRRTFER